jgi:hypothetical protein
VSSIYAAQLIFANVEADQSPRRRRGYHTLCYSQELLSEAEVSEIENRLFYVPRPEGPPPAKHLFFPSETGKLVLGQIVPVAGTDQFGRAGRYFAHALAFAPEDFARFRNDPFALFGRFRFNQSVEQVAPGGTIGSVNLPPALLAEPGERPAPPSVAANPRAVPADLQSLLLLAAQASTLVEERRAVCFLGEPPAMLGLLANLFHYLPAPLRVHCSFDTLYVDGALSRQAYWAVGLPPGEPRRPNLAFFDLGASRFLDEPAPSPTTAFEIWMQRQLAAGSLADFSASAEIAFGLGELFDGRPADPAALAVLCQRPDLVQEFARLHRRALDNRLRDALNGEVGAVFAERIAPAAQEWLQEPEATLQYLQEGLDEERLTQWVLATFQGRPSIEDARELQRIAARHPESDLRLVSMRWSRQWAGLSAELERLEEARFRRFAEWALGTVRLRPEWRVLQDDEGFFFPYVATEELEDEEALSLLLGLLGRSVDDLPEAATGDRGKKRGFRWPWQAEEESKRPVVKLRPRRQLARWEWLGAFLADRQGLLAPRSD